MSPGFTAETTRRYYDLISGRRRGFGAMLQRAVLGCVSWAYASAAWTRNRLYDCRWRRVYRVGVPVLSVGNLTMGGTGKTPFVEYLARHLSQVGLQTAILSRGYGRTTNRNDEALVLETNLPEVPHLQGADRVELARIAIDELESDVLILDDGFQHRRLHRVLDIVLIDALQPWGYGHICPRGLLRESPRELRRADVVVITRCDQSTRAEVEAIRDRVRRLAANTPVLEAIHRPLEFVNSNGDRRSLEQLVGASAAAFCGIGNPIAFRQALEGTGSHIASWREFPDHHPYSRKDVESLEQWADDQNVGFVLTTQKDLVKLGVPNLGSKPLWALKIGLAVTAGENQLHETIARVLSQS